ncbi:MAG: Ribonuclease 3 [Candidatus Woesebacteria bacterium GW2011_GWC1_38_13]|uniref:Ribonuclease 3 n=4 Tax=Candidatus Woeseibacteriota TaxID=1752722 RepID=A0A0G0KV53_9BACT|nr:MAG: Ribonuclease 3 [Candidatus Woesebacteria bacterium GW2011_GWD1_38_10]KKQ56975.1 MAG: Ribonuclease 3 [Candidatus Woesebacteria bacterium GW2011_GWC1_38_13]KKQ83568.1 MAG: Ribonuclease 3 [Candidatus Woesebacteria bacterium GW2011_GWA1_38_8]
MNTYISLKKSFNDKDLLKMSLTHRSWVNEHKNTRRSNERLEFLGDAILEFVVSDKIYAEFTNKEEGFLTALRARIVNTVNLADLAKELQLGDYIFLSKGEEDSGGRLNQSLLADTVEAVIGAIYLDKGLDICKKFIEKHLLSDLDNISHETLKDPKSLFQEEVQAKGYATPKYHVIKEIGPDHNKIFTIQVSVDGKEYGVGTGKSKNEAAQNAAKDALSKSL